MDSDRSRESNESQLSGTQRQHLSTENTSMVNDETPEVNEVNEMGVAVALSKKNSEETEMKDVQVTVLDTSSAPATAQRTLNGPNPELSAGFLSKMLFLWVNPLFAYSKHKTRQNLEIEQVALWDIHPQDKSEVIAEAFDEGWSTAARDLVKAHSVLPSDGGPDNNKAARPTSEKEAYHLLKSGLWAMGGGRLMFSGAWLLLSSCFMFTYPVLLAQIVGYIQDVDSREFFEGYMYAVAIFIAMICRTLANNAYFFHLTRAAYNMRSCVTSAVYRKSLRLSSSSRQDKTIGEIVNIMQLDATKLEQFIMQVHQLWNGAMQVIVYLFILYFYIGWATFVGLAVMLLSIPMNLVIMAKLFKIINLMVGVTDSRVKVTNECLQGMLGVKMAAWEENFISTIEEMRKAEVKLLRRSVILRGFFSAFINAMPAVTACCAVSAYALTGGEINATNIFTAIATFEQLRIPLLVYPQAISSYVQARISARRIANFLSLEEVNSLDDVKSEGTNEIDASTAIKVTNGEFFWSNPVSNGNNSNSETTSKEKKAPKLSKKEKKTKDLDDVDNPAYSVEVSTTTSAVVAGATAQTQTLPVLKDINCTISRGSLTAVVGPVGSGKSSFCNAILGEMHKTKGSVSVTESTAYAAQSPWILNATVRDNIIFGEPFDEKRYWRVMDACQLTRDLEIMQSGDQTMIGERGINLSGGQKQRISVARAAYSRKKIVILDDPLSALDPGVANKMFKECIVKFLSDRTRVLVTNQLNFLKRCDWIVVLSSTEAVGAQNGVYSSTKSNESAGSEDANGTSVSTSGYIAEQGTFTELNDAGLDFASLFERFGEGDTRRQSTAPGDGEAETNEQGNLIDDDNAKKAKDEQTDKVADELMSTEERKTGAVSFAEYANYIKAGGGWAIFGFILFMFSLSQAVNVFATQWVGIWTRSASKGYEDFTYVAVDIPVNGTMADSDTPMLFYVVGYVIVAVLVAAVTFSRTVSIMLFGLRAAESLHTGLLTRILGAPMSFFDQTPIGRIVSRFSKDMHQVDNEVGQFYQFFLGTTNNVLATLAIISYSTPLFLCAVLPLMVVYFKILQKFRPVTRTMKRLESISRSPIYAGFSQTLGGLSTIRAFGESKTFERTSAANVDRNILNFYTMRSADRWLGIRLEFLGSIVAGLAAVLAVYGSQVGTIDASQAGVSLSLGFSITTFLTFTVRSAAELESGMNAVERLSYYANNVEQEAKRESDSPPPKEWPTNGEIVIKDLHMRYRKNTPLVLKGISLTIQGGHRVGVIGRTGSGKSSLMMVLLRLVEPEFDGPTGPIFLDRVDTTKIGLLELRRTISIVPQSPVIFSGTLRSNMDPFDAYSDASIWGALEKCNLKTMVAEFPEKLQHPVSEYGENFSQGQRQLLCLARSLLEQCQVLLLDEATSSVDFETDELIQKTIRSEDSFGGCTVLTIAHRINTVIDSDRILVLDQGTVAEYDAPQTLLADPNSILSSMASGREGTSNVVG